MKIEDVQLSFDEYVMSESSKTEVLNIFTADAVQDNLKLRVQDFAR